jgi:hypothetical protein
MTHDTKHTPGPWMADGLTVHGVTDNHPNFVLKPDGTPVWVAQMICGNPEPEDYANARLIAAAPEMLDALLIQEDESRLQSQGSWINGVADPNHEAFVKWLGPAKEGQTGMDRHRELSALRRQMRYEAIAKATGQEAP